MFYLEVNTLIDLTYCVPMHGGTREDSLDGLDQFCVDPIVWKFLFYKVKVINMRLNRIFLKDVQTER